MTRTRNVEKSMYPFLGTFGLIVQKYILNKQVKLKKKKNLELHHPSNFEKRIGEVGSVGKKFWVHIGTEKKFEKAKGDWMQCMGNITYELDRHKLAS